MRSEAKTLAAMVALGVAWAATSGCETRLTGNEGNLTFSYTADDDITNFNKPIAVGAKLDVEVLEAGTDRPTQVQSASFDGADVLRVGAIDAEIVTIEALGEGSALLEVEARRPASDGAGEGEVVADSINLLAKVPEVLVLSHTCTADDAAAYLAGAEDVLVPFDMEQANGQPIIGYGYHPITIEPASGASLDTASRDQARFHLDLGASAGEVTLASTIDDTALTMTVVEEAGIDGVEINEASQSQWIEVDASAFLHFWPTVGGMRVCQAQVPHEAAVLTPEVCVVEALVSPEGAPVRHESLYVRLTGVETGECRFTVTLPGASGGQGVTQEFQMTIRQKV